jgi:holo-[acyl-carrier protein] synthase
MLKIGTDICSIQRIKLAYERYGERFLASILTDNERKYVSEKPKQLYERLAVRFAGKEAVSKALGVGWRGINWKDVEIANKPSGAPYVILHGRAKTLAEKLDLSCFEISLSHEREFAIASVLAYKNG